jgi:glutamine cyclotransferase
MKMHYLLLLLVSIFMFSCENKPSVNKQQNASNNGQPANTATATAKTVQNYTYEIVKKYPHDSKAFTQGLIVKDGVFYEGTGGRKSDSFHSSLRKVEIESGKVLQKKDLAPEIFGEGITVFNDKIYQITWQENTCFVYDLNFNLLKEFKYSGEGWGITHDGTNLIMSDGTHVIRYMNPETFEVVRTLIVLENGKPLMEINELEYIKDEIWANVWQTGFIYRIDPKSGNVIGKIDFNKLADEVAKDEDNSDVLNGIAYDAQNDRIFITGKLWKNIYEVNIVPKN